MGSPASRTQRLINGMPAGYDDPIILVGAAEAYEARCRKHHEVPIGVSAAAQSIRALNRANMPIYNSVVIAREKLCLTAEFPYNEHIKLT